MGIGACFFGWLLFQYHRLSWERSQWRFWAFRGVVEKCHSATDGGLTVWIGATPYHFPRPAYPLPVGHEVAAIKDGNGRLVTIQIPSLKLRVHRQGDCWVTH